MFWPQGYGTVHKTCISDAVKLGYAVPIFEISSQNGCLFSWGANKHM